MESFSIKKKDKYFKKRKKIAITVIKDSVFNGHTESIIYF